MNTARLHQQYAISQAVGHAAITGCGAVKQSPQRVTDVRHFRAPGNVRRPK
jgi:hypothetical protein